MTTLHTHNAGVHHLVEQQVRYGPDRPALRDGDIELTYAELDAAADQLARRLRARGVCPEEPVMIGLSRSAEFVIAAYGVLKAGAYYVPVDPEYPAARQELLIAESSARVVVTTAAVAGRLPTHGATTLLVDLTETDAPGASGESAGGDQVHPDALAYVIYTSGSTGRPKGVAVSHRAVADLVTADSRLAVAPGESVAHLAPTAFDASTFEIWCALARGGRVVVLGRGGVTTESLGTDLRGARPDWLFLTTGLFHLLVDHDARSLAGVAHVITGGDVLAPRQIRRASSVAPEVFAAYGPTENTVFCCLHHASRDSVGQRVPLGSPLAGKHMYVMDAKLHPMPDGEVGEIYVGGTGVARGYQGQARLTAERFLPDPYSDEPGARMYRTGDLGRRLPDGEFGFLGRVDRQVKIRGFRVELGEIESGLGRLRARHRRSRCGRRERWRQAAGRLRERARTSQRHAGRRPRVRRRPVAGLPAPVVLRCAPEVAGRRERQDRPGRAARAVAAP